MSDNTFHNYRQRDLFSIYKTEQLSDSFFKINYPITFLLSIDTNTNVAYATAADNGYFSVDGTGLITVTKSGLYCVSPTAVFNETVPAVGVRKQWIEIVIGGIFQTFCYTSIKSTGFTGSVNNPIISGSVTLALEAGMTIRHKVYISNENCDLSNETNMSLIFIGGK